MARTQLTVNTAGATRFGGAIGNTTAADQPDDRRPGHDRLLQQRQRRDHDRRQTYGDDVDLGGNGTITMTSSGGGAISFGKTVNGTNANLSVNTSGATTFSGVVGGTGVLSTLTTNNGGTTTISGGAITTTVLRPTATR